MQNSRKRETAGEDLCIIRPSNKTSHCVYYYRLLNQFLNIVLPLNHPEKKKQIKASLTK